MCIVVCNSTLCHSRASGNPSDRIKTLSFIFRNHLLAYEFNYQITSKPSPLFSVITSSSTSTIIRSHQNPLLYFPQPLTCLRVQLSDHIKTLAFIFRNHFLVYEYNYQITSKPSPLFSVTTYSPTSSIITSKPSPLFSVTTYSPTSSIITSKPSPLFSATTYSSLRGCKAFSRGNPARMFTSLRR
jgi:hypothetical protein